MEADGTWWSRSWSVNHYADGRSATPPGSSGDDIAHAKRTGRSDRPARNPTSGAWGLGRPHVAVAGFAAVVTPEAARLGPSTSG